MSQTPRHVGNSRHSHISPYDVGVFLDRADQGHVDLVDALRMAIAELRATPDLDRDINIHVLHVDGPPRGALVDVVAAWKDFVQDGMKIAVVGPFDDDSCAALAEHIEAAHVVSLSPCATDRFAGRFCFQFQLGHPGDTMHLLVRHARAAGAARIGFVYDPGPKGLAAERLLRTAIAREGAAYAGSAALSKDAGGAVDELKRLGADAILYVGGMRHADIAAAARTDGAGPLLLTGTELIHAHPAFGRRDALEGWTGLDAVHPDNLMFQRFAAAFEARYGRAADHALAAIGYDMGRVLAANFAVIRPPSSDGLRQCFERTRMLRATLGAPGTLISFAAYDHRGYKGRDLIVRTVRDGKMTPLPATGSSCPRRARPALPQAFGNTVRNRGRRRS